MSTTHYKGTEQTDWICEHCEKKIGDGDGFVLILPEDSDWAEIYCDPCWDEKGRKC